MTSGAPVHTLPVRLETAITGTYTGDFQLQALSSIGSGQKDVTTAGTAEPLSSTSIPCRAIAIKAKSTNTGNIYVGDSSVSSSTGFILRGSESITLDIDDVSKVYIDADVDGEGVSFIYLV